LVIFQWTILKILSKKKNFLKSYNKIRMNLYIDTNSKTTFSLSFKLEVLLLYRWVLETFIRSDSFYGYHFKDLILKTKPCQQENNFTYFSLKILTNNKINNFLFIHITRILIERKLRKVLITTLILIIIYFFSHRDLYIPLGIDNITPLFNIILQLNKTIA
jgi:hypothetical protein